MTKKEIHELSNLRHQINATDRYQTRDEAWKCLQDYAEAHGYGSRFCSLEDAMQWLMSSQSMDVRMKTLKLYGTYCAASANVETANCIGLTLANIGI